jgi:hypothetical protein
VWDTMFYREKVLPEGEGSLTFDEALGGAKDSRRLCADAG